MFYSKKYDDDPAYVAHCKCGCGGILMAIVDMPEHAAHVAREISKCVRAGYFVEHVTVGYVRAGHIGCLKERANQSFQPTLLTGGESEVSASSPPRR